MPWKREAPPGEGLFVAAKRPEPPKSLRAPGKRLWRAILRDLDPGWELDARELHMLLRACRCADELDRLERVLDRDGVTVEGSRGQTIVHPALSEARQIRLAQMRLLGAIELVDPQAAIRSATPAQARARKAAETRWDMERAGHHG
jgi:P27 family predicted phage terminase small subunit